MYELETHLYDYDHNHNSKTAQKVLQKVQASDKSQKKATSQANIITTLLQATTITTLLLHYYKLARLVS